MDGSSGAASFRPHRGAVRPLRMTRSVPETEHSHLESWKLPTEREHRLLKPEQRLLKAEQRLLKAEQRLLKAEQRLLKPEQ
jgi:hypothetical protein